MFNTYEELAIFNFKKKKVPEQDCQNSLQNFCNSDNVLVRMTKDSSTF